MTTRVFERALSQITHEWPAVILCVVYVSLLHDAIDSLYGEIYRYDTV